MLQLVDRMTLAPNRCLICGCGNVENEDRTLGPFIDLGIDYNWGDSGYLCVPCASRIATLIGWVTPEEQQSFEAQLEKKNREIHDLRSKLELRGRRNDALTSELSKIREGSRALKRVRKEKVA